MLARLVLLGTQFFERSEEARWALCSQVTTSAGNFLTVVILSRGSDLSLLGKYSVFFLLTMIARSFFVGMVLVPFSTRFPQLKERSKPFYIGYSLVAAAISSIVLAGAVTIVVFMLSAPYGIELTETLSTLLFIATLGVLGAEYCRRYFFVQRLGKLAFLHDFLRYGLHLALLAASILLGYDLHLELVLATGALSSIVAISGAAYHITLRRWSFKYSAAIATRDWQFSKWMVVHIIGEAILSNGLLLIAGLLTNPATLGTVRAAQALANTVNIPLNALQQIAPSLAARALHERGDAGLTQFVRNMLSWSALGAVIGFFPLVAASREIMAFVFGFASSSAGTVFSLFLVSNVLFLFRIAYSTKLQVLGRSSALAISSALGAIAASAMISVTYNWGPVSVPSAYVIAAMITTFFLMIASSRRAPEIGL